MKCYFRDTMLPSTQKYIQVIVAIYLLCAACKKEETPDPSPVQLLNAVNQLRQTGCTCGTTLMPPVPPLVWNDTLAIAAQGHVADMYTHNYFSHIAPDGSSPIQRAAEAGYKGNYVGENLAMGYNTINAVMMAWQNSEEHCKAMMDTLYKEMGAAETHDYWALEFGRYK